MLGLPDLYDTTYRSEGVGAWCVMGAGSWNNNGNTPGHFCAWSKIKLGWQESSNVRKPQSLTLAAVEDATAGKIYRLWTKGKLGDEYFLLENRQLRGFDAKLPGSGLLIWHIDDTQHNNDHPGTYWVALVQADGRNDLEVGRNRGDANDPFPGGKQNTNFDDSTSPASLDNLGNSTFVAVRNITETAGQVTCDVDVTPPE
jgi:immune inhibitor A